MLKDLKDLFFLLTSKQKKKLYLLQVLVILMSFTELVSLISIGPFMAIVGDTTILDRPGILSSLKEIAGIQEVDSFLIFLALLIVFVLFISSTLSMYTIWRLSMYAAEVGAELSSRLYNFYIYKPWLFHAQSNSTQLTNKIAQECERVSSGIITPLMQMNAKIVLVIFMSVAICIYSPLIAMLAISLFCLAYFLMFKTVRERFARNGLVISSEQALRFKYMGEGFGGIKDLLLYGRQQNINNDFLNASKNFANAKGMTQTLSQIPRYAIEFLAFSGVLLLMAYLIKRYDGSLGTILPFLSIFVLAGLKLLPAFQQIYFALSQVRANLSAFNNIKQDLQFSIDSKISLQSNAQEDFLTKPIKFNESITLKEVNFFFPSVEKLALENINLKISKNKLIGIVGSSGSGKSTLIDILMGLIPQSSGKIFIDDTQLDNQNIRTWQDKLGFVSQSIFLSDSSIRENIAFGISPNKIDEDKIIHACKLAHLNNLIDQLEDGLGTNVGERGIQLSGGQRQRIGIARALYNDADILFFDEATSALDGITEKYIMESINEFMGKKTIILIAHRLSTVKKCDAIYILEEGKIIDHGSFDELSTRNSFFQEMLDHS
jgi:HlyD family secretion protein